MMLPVRISVFIFAEIGWKCKCDPPDHVVSEYEFDVLIGADGKRNTLQGEHTCHIILYA